MIATRASHALSGYVRLARRPTSSRLAQKRIAKMDLKRDLHEENVRLHWNDPIEVVQARLKNTMKDLAKR